MTCTFESLTPADREVIRGWHAHEAVKRWCFIDDWDAYFALPEGNPGCYMFKASLDGKLLGFFHLEMDGGEGHLLLIVDPAAHHRGIGRRLLGEFLKRAPGLTGGDPSVIVANICPGNATSIRCFEACGFRLRGKDADGDLRYEYRMGG